VVKTNSVVRQPPFGPFQGSLQPVVMFQCRDKSRRSPTFLSVFHITLLAASAFSSFLPRASAFAFCSGSLSNLSLRSHPINSRTAQHNVRPADIRQRCLSGVANLKAIEFAQPEFTTYPQQVMCPTATTISRTVQPSCDLPFFSKKAPSPWKQTCKMNLIGMQVFTLVNFAVLPFWAAMIGAPKNSEVCAEQDARK